MGPGAAQTLGSRSRWRAPGWPSTHWPATKARPDRSVHRPRDSRSGPKAVQVARSPLRRVSASLTRRRTRRPARLALCGRWRGGAGTGPARLIRGTCPWRLRSANSSRSNCMGPSPFELGWVCQLVIAPNRQKCTGQRLTRDTGVSTAVRRLCGWLGPADYGLIMGTITSDSSSGTKKATHLGRPRRFGCKPYVYAACLSSRASLGAGKPIRVAACAGAGVPTGLADSARLVWMSIWDSIKITLLVRRPE